MTRHTRIAAVLLVALLVFAAPGFAGVLDLEASPWTSGESYNDKVGGKFVFGVTNILFGWTDIITVTLDQKEDGDICPLAFGKGVIKGLTNTAGGVLHTVTCLLPIDVPLPGGGTHILEK